MSTTIPELIRRATKIAEAKGYVDASVPEDIALMHSELSEALEEYRKLPNMPNFLYYEPDGKPCGIPSELADVVIRIFHFCGKHKIDLEDVILAKMPYNVKRPYKHGGKRI